MSGAALRHDRPPSSQGSVRGVPGGRIPVGLDISGVTLHFPNFVALRLDDRISQFTDTRVGNACALTGIREAYHRLIKRVHPDSGGSAALTAQITEARNRLLGDQQSLD